MKRRSDRTLSAQTQELGQFRGGTVVTLKQINDQYGCAAGDEVLRGLRTIAAI